MNTETKNVNITTADPSALGLFGLAMITLVASTQKLGWTHGYSFVIPWAIFLGACLQLIACLNDIKRNNVFGATAFGGYAFFWFAVAMSWTIKIGGFGDKFLTDMDTRQLGVAFIGYLIFTLIMTIGSMETNKILFIIFVLIDLLFIGLSLSSFNIMKELTTQVAGYSELLISIFSFYACGACVLNAHFGKVHWPVGKPFGIFKK